MQNKRAALARRLSDPDFQGSLVGRCLALTMLMMFVLVGFVAHDAYVWTHPAPPKYFFVDGINRPRPVMPLDSPIVDDAELLQWTVKWALSPYNINYHDYASQLTIAGEHFTIGAWRSFAQSFISSGDFEKLKQAQMLCWAQATRAAVVKQRRVFLGRYTYLVQFPATQVCENTNQTNPLSMMVTATVQRVDDPDHPDGLAISQLVTDRWN